MSEEKANRICFAEGELLTGGIKYYKKDFWSEENRRYSLPHFRMLKSGPANPSASP